MYSSIILHIIPSSSSSQSCPIRTFCVIDGIQRCNLLVLFFHALKKWLDEVFTHGWAYGTGGDKLKGKKWE